MKQSKEDFQLVEGANKLEFDIMDIPSICVIVICDGVAKLRELPPFGEYNIVTHQGKVKRKWREEGEEF